MLSFCFLTNWYLPLFPIPIIILTQALSFYLAPHSQSFILIPIKFKLQHSKIKKVFPQQHRLYKECTHVLVVKGVWTRYKIVILQLFHISCTKFTMEYNEEMVFTIYSGWFTEVSTTHKSKKEPYQNTPILCPQYCNTNFWREKYQSSKDIKLLIWIYIDLYSVSKLLTHEFTACVND